MVAHKVAIIGGGVAGLASIKCCLDAGLQPRCFEQQSWLGGLWKYCEEPLPNIASVHHSTVANTSKAMSCFSDFPVPKEYPNYMPHRLLQKYLEMYAEHFGLVQHMQFNTVVEKLSRSDEHADTGCWEISYRQLEEESSGQNKSVQETFDAVMICTGHQWDKSTPKILGMERFKGVQIHSGDYRTFHPYVGKRVVVVGCGNSAGDIACELSHHASQVYLSTRSGCFIFERLASNGKPLDMQLSRLGTYLPRQIKLALVSGLVNKKYNMTNLGLQPTGTLGVTQFPIVNDALPHRVITGSIVVKGDIKEITQTAVVFEDGEVMDDIDALVFCTGFKFNYPFAKEIICVKNGHITSLYKHIFLPDVDKHTLAVIGAVDIEGADPPVFEMQARVASEVFAGRCSLPDKCTMVAMVEKRQESLRSTGVTEEKMMRVGFVDYLDELADMIGVKPPFWSLLWKDPKLALRCFFGPCVPAQYRLKGPNSKNTRAIINSVEENYLFPLRTRKCTALKVKSTRHTYVLVSCLLAIVTVMWVVFGY